MTRLFGQTCDIPGAEFGDRPRQREFIIQVAKEVTMERLEHLQFRPIGIPYLTHTAVEDMKANRKDWPDIPANDGVRRRIQECSDPRFFSPVPLRHLPIKFKDIDPQATSGMYEVQMRPTSCYLVNPIWCLEEGSADWFEISKDFAFKVLRVENMQDLKAALSGMLSR